MTKSEEDYIEGWVRGANGNPVIDNDRRTRSGAFVHGMGFGYAAYVVAKGQAANLPETFRTKVDNDSFRKGEIINEAIERARGGK